MPYFLLSREDPEGSAGKGDHQRPASGKLWLWQVEPLAIRRKLGDGTTPSSDVYFDDGSLLVVDVSELKEKAAITGAPLREDRLKRLSLPLSPGFILSMLSRMMICLFWLHSAVLPTVLPLARLAGLALMSILIAC